MTHSKGPEVDSDPARQASGKRRKYLILKDRRIAVDPSESLEARARRLFGRSRRDLIQDSAYLLSRSGRAKRGPDADWLEAEASVDAMLRGADEG